ncbi:MAG: hypothetical protein Q8J85_09540 [Sulfuricurvum sp.]|nr:hypothetical protein [Sulfuricurvum sp.]MDP3022760.1 hypothetical protein [Sulfuricurvum sp.]
MSFDMNNPQYVSFIALLSSKEKGIPSEMDYPYTKDELISFLGTGNDTMKSKYNISVAHWNKFLEFRLDRTNYINAFGQLGGCESFKVWNRFDSFESWVFWAKWKDDNTFSDWTKWKKSVNWKNWEIWDKEYKKNEIGKVKAAEREIQLNKAGKKILNYIFGITLVVVILWLNSMFHGQNESGARYEDAHMRGARGR